MTSMTGFDSLAHGVVDPPEIRRSEPEQREAGLFPEALQGFAELRGACPASARVMQRRIA